MLLKRNNILSELFRVLKQGYSNLHCRRTFFVYLDINYPINSLERQSVILALTASATFGKQNPKQSTILSNSTFYNLSVYICGGFLENSARTNFFSGGHRRRCIDIVPGLVLLNKHYSDFFIHIPQNAQKLPMFLLPSFVYSVHNLIYTKSIICVKISASDHWERARHRRTKILVLLGPICTGLETTRVGERSRLSRQGDPSKRDNVS